MKQEATMNPDDGRIPPDNMRPESQPHGTTADQISEMESEGPGGTVNDDAKPTCIPPPHPARTIPISGVTVVK